VILVPFGVNRWTAFLSEKAFGSIVGFGMKLMVLAFIMSAATPVMMAITLPVDPTIKQAYCTLLAAAFIAFLAWHAPGVAASMMSGGPSLTAAVATRTAVAGAMGGAAVAGGAASAALGAANAGRVATLAAARGAGAVSSAGEMGSATAAMGGAGPLGQAAGAVGGVARAAGGAVASTAMTPVRAVSESLKAAYARGEFGGWRSLGFKGKEPPAPPAAATPGAARGRGGLSAATHAMHVVPPEASPSGGGAGPDLHSH